MEFKDIVYEKGEGVAKITINRPEKRNAFRLETLQEMYEALVDASLDRSIGVVVLTGAGDRAFCSGVDVSGGEPPGLRSLSRAVVREITHMPKPVIAAVNGYAIGGGNWLQYICDLTIASENAIFGQVGPRVGSPPTGQLAPYLAMIIGQKRAREMWMLCHQYSAQEALEMGLINKVVASDELQNEVDKWCQELLDLSPTALKAAKFCFATTIQFLHVAEPSYELIGSEYLGSEESREGMNAFLEKRQPNFRKFRRGQAGADM